MYIFKYLPDSMRTKWLAGTVPKDKTAAKAAAKDKTAAQDATDDAKV